MSAFESMNHEQREFEQALQQLQPLAPQLNTAELMYRAGQDAARRDIRRQLRYWQLSTLVTSVCAMTAVAVLWPGSSATSSANNTSIVSEGEANRVQPVTDVTPEEQPALPESPIPPQIAVDAEAPPAEPQIPFFDWWKRSATVSVSADGSYLDLRNRVLRNGVDALPERDLDNSSSETREPLTSSPLRLREALEQDLWNQI